MMKIFVNNQEHEMQHSISLDQLLVQLQFASTKGIALAVNNQVISKSEWNQYLINANDHITIIRATQGG